jgi:leucyl-tRNA synthetase
MSKSLKNVIDPDYLIEKYGCDTARMFCLFASPPEKDLEWSDQGVEGSFRFLGRVWRLVMDYLDDIRDVERPTVDEEPDEDFKKLRRKTHQTIRKVTTDIEDRFRFNTAISAVMELVNLVYQIPRPEKGNRAALAALREAIETVVVLLAPIVPHIAEELWEMMDRKELLARSSWPSYDPGLASEEELTIVIQVNGKLRSRIVVSADESEEKIKELALADEKTQKFLEGVAIVKIIAVPKKLVNIVVK